MVVTKGRLPRRALGRMERFASCLILMSLLGCALIDNPRVETIPALANARAHVPDGVAVDYGTPYPTSGVHSERRTEPGFYADRQPLPRLVHALEHGTIVIYYGEPGEEVLATLRAWCEGHQGGAFGGIIAVPDPKLSRGIVLTAWEHRLVLRRFNGTAAQEFIHAYHGRGPEQSAP